MKAINILIIDDDGNLLINGTGEGEMKPMKKIGELIRNDETFKNEAIFFSYRSDPEIAINHLKEEINSYSLILLDGFFRKNKIGSEKIVEEIRKISKTIPIVMASTNERINENGKKAGANDSIDKFLFFNEARIKEAAETIKKYLIAS